MTENSHLFIKTEIGIEGLSLERMVMKICKKHDIPAVPYVYNGEKGVKMDANASYIFRGEAID